MTTCKTTLVATLGLLALITGSSGCRSVIQSANHTTGIPLSRLPDGYRVRPKSELVEISLGSLRQDPPKDYKVDAGDVLGVYIENVIGEEIIGENERIPRVHFGEDPSKAPAVGHPIPVRDDGTISVPFIQPLKVAGMTVIQVEDAIRTKYQNKKILKEGKDRITVGMIRPRSYRVLVVREEEGGKEGVKKRGTGHIVDLPAGENDLLHALSETGGLPGTDAKNEVLIYRGMFKDAASRNAVMSQINACPQPCCWKPPKIKDAKTVRVPLRYFPDQPPEFDQEDITLRTGDIVMVQSRDEERFYTGGLLGGGEHLMPRDRDIDVLQAIAIAGGQLGSGAIGIGGRQGGFGRAGGGTGIQPSQVTVLRKTPCGSQIPIRLNVNDMMQDPRNRLIVKQGDVIILRYTFAEEMVNTALGLVQFNFLFNGFRGSGI